VFDYANAIAPGRGYDRAAAECLARATAALAREPLPPSLFGGFVGVAWVAEFLQRVGVDANAEIDAALLDFVSQRPWRREIDLIGGLVGFGVYAMLRMHRQPSARAILEQVILRLGELAERHENGWTWRTPAAQLPPVGRSRMPHGVYNLGLAHGIPA